MNRLVMFVGIIRIVCWNDYRSRGKRKQLRRLGRRVLNKSFDFISPNQTESGPGSDLRTHSNAKSF
ncbi:MAG: hypothetical protein ABEK50_11050 [bacterium]